MIAIYAFTSCYCILERSEIAVFFRQKRRRISGIMDWYDREPTIDASKKEMIFYAPKRMKFIFGDLTNGKLHTVGTWRNECDNGVVDVPATPKKKHWERLTFFFCGSEATQLHTPASVEKKLKDNILRKFGNKIFPRCLLFRLSSPFVPYKFGSMYVACAGCFSYLLYFLIK